MIPRDGHIPQPGDALTARGVDALMDTARSAGQFTAGMVDDGMMATVDAGGINLQRANPTPYATQDASSASYSFVAKVVDKGPDNLPDYDDARYWVQEVWPVFNLGDAPLELSNEGLVKDNPEPDDYPLRWLTATNLAEWRPEVSDQTHELDADGSIAVRVRRFPAPDGVPRFYFEHGGGGGGGAKVKLFSVGAEREDTFTANEIIDGVPVAEWTIIAKPRLLQQSRTLIPDSSPIAYGETVDRLWGAFSLSYDYHTPYHRTATSAQVPEDQWIVRPYMFGDTIEAMKVGAAVTELEDVPWLDLNTSARRWMENPSLEP